MSGTDKIAPLTKFQSYIFDFVFRIFLPIVTRLQFGIS